MESGKMVKDVEEEYYIIMTDPFMKEFGKMIRLMIMGELFMQMAMYMRDIGSRDRLMVQENISTIQMILQKFLFIQGNLKMEKRMALENLFGLIKALMQVDFKTIRFMEKVFINGVMEEIMKEIGKMGK